MTSQQEMARLQQYALNGGMALPFGDGSAYGIASAQMWRPQGLELLAQRPLPRYSAQDAKAYSFDAKLADCHKRRKAAIMKAAREIGQPYP